MKCIWIWVLLSVTSLHQPPHSFLLLGKTVIWKFLLVYCSLWSNYRDLRGGANSSWTKEYQFRSCRVGIRVACDTTVTVVYAPFNWLERNKTTPSIGLTWCVFKKLHLSATNLSAKLSSQFTRLLAHTMCAHHDISMCKQMKAKSEFHIGFVDLSIKWVIYSWTCLLLPLIWIVSSEWVTTNDWLQLYIIN